MSDKCINCLTELTDRDCRLKHTFDFTRKIFTNNEAPKRKRGRPPRQNPADTPKTIIEVVHVLNLVFQMLDHPDPMAKGKGPSPDDGLCVHCAEVLAHLFSYYIQFVFASKSSSYIHGLLQRLESLQRHLGRHLSQGGIGNNEGTSPSMTYTWSSDQISLPAPESKSFVDLQTNDFEGPASPCDSDTGSLSMSLPNSMNPKLVLERLHLDIKLEPLDFDIPDGNDEDEADIGLVNFKEETGLTGDSKPKRTYSKRTPVKSKEADESAGVKIKNSSLRRKSTNNWNLTSTKKFSPCKKCCEIYNYKSHLKIHMNTHTEMSKHECPVCVCAFKTRQQLRTHMFKEHPNSPVPWISDVASRLTFSDFNCDRCKRKFLTGFGLRRHVVEQHLHCPLCNTDYSTPEEVNAHMETHGQNWARSTLVCEQCGYQTERRCLMRRHKIRVHSEACKNMCNVCGKGLEGSWALAKHMLSHTDERPYKCDRCPMTYKFSSNLRAHKMVHDGIKFVCDHCGHASSSPANLRKHIAGVHHRVPQVQKRTPDEVKKKRVRPKDFINTTDANNAQMQMQNVDSFVAAPRVNSLPSTSQPMETW